MDSEETLESIYARFAEKDLNIMSTSISDDWAAVVAEYMYVRKKDGKPVWPKIAVEAGSLKSAIIRVEQIVNSIREA